MFTEISVNNFKLFKERTVFDNLKPINLLTGVNGRGKSSFIQLLLLPKQAILANRQFMDLLLDGEYVCLGNAIDVKNIETRREEPIMLVYCNDNVRAEFEYHVNEENNQVLEFVGIDMKVNNELTDVDVTTMEKLSRDYGLGLHGIQYVSAERLGPKLYYAITENDGYIGPKGEFTVSQLYAHKNDTVSNAYLDELCDMFPELSREDISSNFTDQIEFWMSKMFKATHIDTAFQNEANVLTLKISTAQHVNDKFKPTNVGFGYTYILPIVVAGMIAKPGDTLVIENPEAHLHPSAQSIIGKYITVLANTGVQLFVESHSEHILNSFRVCIKQGHLDNGNINVMFFEDDNELYYRNVAIDRNGKIESWPSFFYDQEEQDLDIIMS